MFVTNIGISYFSGPEPTLKHFYSSTTIPVLGAALVASAAFYGVAMNDESLQDEMKNQAKDVLSNQIGFVVDSTTSNEAEEQIQSQVEAMSENLIKSTETMVVADMQGSLSAGELQQMQNSFDRASNEIPDEVSGNVQFEQAGETIDPDQLADNYFDAYYTPKALLLIIPSLSLAVFGFQPLVGIIVAILASLFTVVRKEIG